MPSSDNQPSAANTAAGSKPKRPLSGMNLFYRFKRDRVLEATATLRRGAGSAASPDEEKRVIDDVLRAPAGLEGVSPGHAVWALPASALDELRAMNIRRAMEGRLFPNEEKRRRPHRRVHGMGFTEMGRVMREMWAAIDGFAKGVFCELAEVGRVSYRTALAQSRLEDEKAKAGLAKPKQHKNPNYTSFAGAAADAVAPAVIEATRSALQNLGVPDYASPQPVLNGQQAATQAGIPSSHPPLDPRCSSNASQAPVFGMTFGQYLECADIDPLPVDSTTSQGGNSYALANIEREILSKLAGISQSNALTDIERAILSDDTADLEPKPITSSKDTSSEDFMELIGALDEALNNHEVHSMGGGKKLDDCPSMILSKPIHNVQASNTALPDAYMLNSFGARMA